MSLKLPSDILIVAAHSDDEVLMAGGLLIKNKNLGGSNKIIFFTDGTSSRGESCKNKQRRYKETQEAANILCAEIVYSGNFPDNKLDSVPLLDIIKIIEKQILLIKPQIIVTHCQDELNIDHQIVGRATLTACRPINDLNLLTILLGNVSSSNEWHINQISIKNNLFIDIEKEKDLKYKALQLYDSEKRNSPNPRSLEMVIAKDKFTGSIAGFLSAESFFIHKTYL